MTSNGDLAARNRGWAAVPGCLALLGLPIIAVLALFAFVTFENSEEEAGRVDSSLDDGWVGGAVEAAERRDRDRQWALMSGSGAGCCCLGSLALLGLSGFLLVRK